MIKKIFLGILLIGFSFGITNANQTIYRLFDGYDEYDIISVTQNDKIKQIKRFDVSFVKNEEDIKDTIEQKNISSYKLILVNDKEKFENSFRTNIYVKDKKDYFAELRTSQFYQNFTGISSFKNRKVYLYVCGNAKISEGINPTSRFFCGKGIEVNFDNDGNIVSNEEYSNVVDQNSNKEVKALDSRRKYLKVVYEQIKASQKFYKDKYFEDFEQHIIDLVREGKRGTNLLNALWAIDYNDRQLVKINGIKEYALKYADLEIARINESNLRSEEEQKAYEKEAIANYSSLKKKYEQLQNENEKLKNELLKYRNNKTISNTKPIINEDNNTSNVETNPKGDAIVAKLMEIIVSKTNTSTGRNAFIKQYIDVIGKSTKIPNDLKDYIIIKLEEKII